MDSIKRWLFPVALGIILAFMLTREQSPMQVFASEDERIEFLRQIGEQRDVRLIALVTAWCPACQALERSLEEEGIPYAKVDLDRSGPGQGLFEKCARLGGSRGIPKTIFGLEMVSASEALKRARSAQREGNLTIGPR